MPICEPNAIHFKVMIPAVFCNDVEKLACEIMTVRDLEPSNTMAQIGIDHGQGLLKFMLTVKKLVEEEQERAKKARYEDGFRPKDFKLSGAKKAFLLLVSPSPAERHDNILTLMSLLKIEALDFGYSMDIKMILIICGKQAASSKFCCPFCISG